MSPEIYGHSAMIECIPRGKTEYVQVQIRRKGPQRVVERAAYLMCCFRQIISIEAYTYEQWVSCFGEGKS